MQEGGEGLHFRQYGRERPQKKVTFEKNTKEVRKELCKHEEQHSSQRQQQVENL